MVSLLVRASIIIPLYNGYLLFVDRLCIMRIVVRQVQELGLVSVHRQREDVRHLCGMLDGLAFLPLNDIQEGLDYVRQQVPADVVELNNLVSYFDATYVNGPLRRVQTNSNDQRLLLRVRRTPALFPPSVWNVHEATLAGRERTNNVCEGWNNAFANMVGHHHPSLWRLIGALQQDQALVATALQQDARGQQSAKHAKRAVHQQQQRLHKLCCERRDGVRTVAATLRALGHCVRLQ